MVLLHNWTIKLTACILTKFNLHFTWTCSQYPYPQQTHNSPGTEKAVAPSYSILLADNGCRQFILWLTADCSLQKSKIKIHNYQKPKKKTQYKQTYEAGAQTSILRRLDDAKVRTSARNPGASIPSSLVTKIVCGFIASASISGLKLSTLKYALTRIAI